MRFRAAFLLTLALLAVGVSNGDVVNAHSISDVPSTGSYIVMLKSFDDIDAVAAAVEAAGGTVVRATRTALDLGGTPLDFVFCTDPDGVRIELMDLGG